MRARQRHLNPASAGATIALDSRFGFAQSDNTAVSTWEDRTATNNDGTQSTATNQPTYQTDEVGGQPAVRFDGSNDYLSYASNVFTYTGDATVIAVAKVTAGSNEYGAIIGQHPSTGFTTREHLLCVPYVFPNNAIEVATDCYNNGGMRYNSTISTNTWYIYCWSWSNWSTHKSNGDTILAYNGLEVGGTPWNQNPLGLATTARSIGRSDANVGGAGHIAADMALVAKLPQCSKSLRKRLYHHAGYSFKIACS